MASFGLRQQAFENSYIREQDVLALQRRAEALATDTAANTSGRAAAITQNGLPTTFASRPAYESVPRYVKNPHSCKQLAQHQLRHAYSTLNSQQALFTTTSHLH